MNCRRLLVPTLLLLAHAIPCGMAGDTASWPHFLGPHFNATIESGALLEEFPEKGLTVLWERDAEPPTPAR